MRCVIGAVAAAALLAGCGGSNNGDNTGGGGGNAPISATVNGAAFTGNTSTIATRNSGVVNMSAFNAAKNQEILFTVHADAAGTYSLESAASGIAEYETTTETNAPQWETGYNGGTGSITFTTLTASGASGTFSFTGAALTSTGASGTVSVTNGKFNVKF